MIIKIITAEPFEITDRNEAILMGAPWYTSAVQKWNGTSEILKANPEKKNMNPITNVRFVLFDSTGYSN